MSPRAGEASLAAPVAAGDRVIDVLARDEALVDVFVRHAPHFAKLRNRAMRRVMARFVTVGQAARMAGIPADALVGDLNAALGIVPDAAVATDDAALPAAPAANAPRTAAPAGGANAGHPADAPVVEVDVREDLRAGREPFSRIMAAVGALGEGEVLHLRAIFEPVPLFAVLGRRGLAHESRCHAPDDWSVWFWRPAGARPAAAEPARIGEPSATPPADVAADGHPFAAAAAAAHSLWLDVRGLQPPEPLMRTLALLESLPAGHELVQVNARVPQFLFPLLVERGFGCDVDESHADRVLVRIRRTG